MATVMRTVRHGRIQRGDGVWTTPEKSQKYRIYSSNSGADPLKNHNATKVLLGHHGHSSEMACRWRADDGLLIVVHVFVWKKERNKKNVKFGPPLTLLSGSARDRCLCKKIGFIIANIVEPDEMPLFVLDFLKY